MPRDDEILVRESLHEHLMVHPRTHRLYSTDGTFHQAVDVMALALTAVVTVRRSQNESYWGCRNLVLSALESLLDDELLVKHERMAHDLLRQATELAIRPQSSSNGWPG